MEGWSRGAFQESRRETEELENCPRHSLGVLPVRVAVLISGGKDSALALHRALEQGHEVVSLVTMVPKREDSWMFHYPNVHLTGLFAEAAGIPLLREETSGIKEEELADLNRVLETLRIDGVVSGAIASKYQKKRIDKACAELGLQSITPLWKENPLILLEELVDKGFKAIIIGVYAYGFKKDWLGREIDEGAIGDLLTLNQKHGISVVGEGGEYETLVIDAPFFTRRIDLVETEKVWENQGGCLHVKRARLVDR